MLSIVLHELARPFMVEFIHALGGRVTKAVDHVFFDVGSDGYTVGLVGESGSGKTSLGMSLMNAIEPPGKITTGQIEFPGSNILEMSDKELMRYR